MIHILKPDYFHEEVVDKKNTFLLLCMPKSDEFKSQVELLEIISSRYADWFNVGILGDPFVDQFKKELNITGTPTFLIFFEGKEVNRKLGLGDLKSLEDFIHEFKDQQKKIAVD